MALSCPHGHMHLWGPEPAWEGLPTLLSGLASAVLLCLCYSLPLIEDRPRCSFPTPLLPHVHLILEGWEGRLHHPHDEPFEYSDVGSWLEMSCLSLCWWSGDNTDSLLYLCSPRASQVPGAAAVIASSPVRCGWRETRTA